MNTNRSDYLAINPPLMLRNAPAETATKSASNVEESIAMRVKMNAIDRINTEVCVVADKIGDGLERN
jgi:hypothetical protein